MRFLKTALNLAAAWCIVGLVPAVQAQVDQGGVGGLVQDSTGAGIPDSNVALTNMDPGLALHTRADAHGLLSFPPEKVGTYRLAASAKGFQTTVREHIHRTPLNARNRVYMVQLTADAAPFGGTHRGRTGDVSANGQHARQNDFLIDGVSIMDLMNSASYKVRPPPNVSFFQLSANYKF